VAVTGLINESEIMAENHSDVLATVDKFFTALATGDQATCEALFTDDAVIWHNYDKVEQPKTEALAALAGLAHLQARFDIVGRDFADNTCVQRHVVRLSLPNGEVAAIPAIQRISLADGRIQRIDEYMDSAQMMAAMQALQAGA
jgi:ketosteroid isomerase-like protein